MKQAAILLVLLPLGGCLSDADTANNRSVLAPTSTEGRAATRDLDEPRQLCEHTMEGGEAKTVCY